MSIGEVFEDEALEQLLPLVAVGIGFWVLYKLVKDQLTVAGFFATVAGPADFVGNGKPLTYPQAKGIAQLIGVDKYGGDWQQSPDSLQIWFSDGSYYDNTTGHFWIKNIDETFTDQGDLRAVINSMKG